MGLFSDIASSLLTPLSLPLSLIGEAATGIIHGTASILFGTNFGSQSTNEFEKYQKEQTAKLLAQRQKEKRLRYLSYRSLYGTTPLGLPTNYLDLYNLAVPNTKQNNYKF